MRLPHPADAGFAITGKMVLCKSYTLNTVSINESKKGFYCFEFNFYQCLFSQILYFIRNTADAILFLDSIRNTHDAIRFS